MSSNEDERRRAVWSRREEIRRIARDVYGAQLVETPIEGFQIASRPGLDDPLAGLRAAVLARDVAAGQMHTYVETARGAGRSWDDIGEALRIEAGESGATRGELAFALVIEGRPLPERAERSFWSERPRARWTCGSCGQRVVDDGPYEAAPFNNEDGHTPDCARHAAEIAAYRAEWGAE